MRRQEGGITLAVIGAVALVVAISLGVYFAVFATAGARGRVALHNQLRQPGSQQFNYEYFHNTCHAIVAEGQQITTGEETLQATAAHPPASDPFGQYQSRLDQMRTDLQGLKNLRDSDAQAYDAKAHEWTRNYMLSRDLPAEIGPPDGVSYDVLTCEGSQP